jgi:uncharacterized repeat protein (TIGR01451 family)
MSIKTSMKRRMLMVVALAMTVALLAAGTAHAATLSKKEHPITMTNTASDPSVSVGEPVTFHLAVTNDEPNAISPVEVIDDLPEGVQFVSASSSQGQCTYDPSHGVNGDVRCNLGNLPAGGTAEVDVVVVPQGVPQEQGVITNLANTTMLWNGNTLLANLTPIIPASVYVYPGATA